MGVAADTTSANTAAGFVDQGDLATLNSVSCTNLDEALRGRVFDGKIEQFFTTSDPSTNFGGATQKKSILGIFGTTPTLKC